MSARVFGSAGALALGLFVACGGALEPSQGSQSEPKEEASDSLPTPPRSCELQAPGADRHCGINHDQDCCASPLVPGGTFNRLNDPRFPATVSSFRMDTFEVTVGRLRRFVEGFPATWPAEGQGANPHIPGSGWRSEWFTRASTFHNAFEGKEAILAQLRCDYELLVDPPRTREAISASRRGPTRPRPLARRDP